MFATKKNQNFGVMKNLAWFLITLSIRNVESSYSQRTKPWPIWIDQSWGLFVQGPQSRANRPRTPIFDGSAAAKSSSKLLCPGIILRCNNSTSHVPTARRTRARNERPPAGPEKYTKVLGNDKCKQHFRFIRFSKKLIFAIKKLKFRSHEKASLDFYNSFNSKRRELIFTED